MSSPGSACIPRWPPKRRAKRGDRDQSLHYSLLKYPKIGDTSSPYLGQVEIEFTSLVPRSARDFHESLLKGDQMVNAKKEIKWRRKTKPIILHLNSIRRGNHEKTLRPFAWTFALAAPLPFLLFLFHFIFSVQKLGMLEEEMLESIGKRSSCRKRREKKVPFSPR